MTFPGRLLAIDQGEKIIGLAVCDASGTLARPLSLLRRKSKKEDFARINTAITEQKAVAVIVGLPESPPGVEGHTRADTVRLWASRLAAAITIPVYLWDERYSTWEAEELLAGTARKRGERVDDVAAAVILQSFLDALRDGQPWPAAVPPATEEE